MLKKILLPIILFSSVSFSQQWEWVRQVNGAANDYTSDIFVDDSAYVYATGRNKEGVTFEDPTNPITPTNYGHTDAFVSKYSKNGELIWAVLAGGPEPDWGWGVCADKLGNVYFTGEFSGTATFGSDLFVSNGGRDVFISKLDKDGNFVWTRVFGGLEEDKGKGIDVDDAGNVYVTGHFKGQQTIGNSLLGTTGVTNAFMVKLDSQGNFIREDDIQPDISYGNKIKCDNLGNVYLCGELLYDSYVADFLVSGPSTLSWRDGFIAKLDTAFNCLWVKVTSGQLHTGVEAFDFNSNYIYTTGFFTYQTTFNDTTLTYNGTGTGSTGINAGRDNYIAKYDLNGNRIWVKGIGGTGYDYGYDISVTENDDIYSCGVFEDTVLFDSDTLISEGGIDQYIFKANGDGAIIWVKQHKSLADIYVYACETDENENLYVGGMYEFGSSNFDGILKSYTQDDAYIAKLTQRPLNELLLNEPGYCENDTIKLIPAVITSPLTINWNNMMPSGWLEGNNYCFVATAGLSDYSGELVVSNNIYSDTLTINELITFLSNSECQSEIEAEEDILTWEYNRSNKVLSITGNSENSTCQIFSSNGQFIIEKTMTNGVNYIDLSACADGLYIIRVINSDQYFESIKLMR